MTRCWISFAIVLQLASLGCSYSSSTTQGNVAVVDLDEAAKQLGLSEQWSAELANQKSKVNEQLVGYQQQLNNQLKSKHAEVAAASSEKPLPQAQQAQLASYQQELNGKLQLAKTQAEKHISAARSQIIRSFRQQAKQVSMDVALANGYDVVLTKNDSVVLNYSPNSDITALVIQELQSRMINAQKTLSEHPENH